MTPTDAHKDRSFNTYETKVEIADHLTPRNVHLRFKLPAGQEIHFKEGQFVQAFIPQPGQDKPRRTSYSIASSSLHPDYIELCVTKVEHGPSSTFLHTLKPGDAITLMGPLGKFGMPTPLTRPPVFIATGSGIAPFRSMIHKLIHDKTDKNIVLIYGNRFDEDIIYLKEWEKLAQENPNFKLLLTLSRPTDKWKGPKGYVQEHITDVITKPSDHDFFICGLSNMINGVQDKLLSLGVPKEQIHYEKYD